MKSIEQFETSALQNADQVLGGKRRGSKAGKGVGPKKARGLKKARRARGLKKKAATATATAAA